MGDASGLNSIEIAEHVGQNATGDNIEAKRVAPYKWDGNNWNRDTVGLFPLPWDELAFSNADANGNYQTITSKLSGGTQNIISLSFDASNNITDIHRTT